MGRHKDTDWGVIATIAKEKGAKYHDLVSAQWALESGWGSKLTGRNNVFGLKGTGAANSSLTSTHEEEGGVMVPQKAWFLDFDSIEACIAYLIDRWYKDFRGHQGVNRASDRNAAAHMLQSEGYATDSRYAAKLITLMDKHAPAAAPAAPKQEQPVTDASPVAAASPVPLLRLRARQDTWLKKEPKEALVLGEKGRSGMGQGRVLEVEQHKELAGDAHAWVKLGHGAGSWFIWGPHWQTVADAVAPVPAAAQVDWDDFACLVTPNLTVGEVLQYDARRKPRSGGDQRRIMATARQFQAIRTAWKYPLGVTSFYRPEPINKQVGGVPGSRHVTGEAVDLYPIGRSLDAFYQWLLPRWSGALGDGRRKGFIHLDTRGNGGFVPGGGVRPFVTWDY
jgi:hypothetical protein